jgi:hypothetical protein
MNQIDKDEANTVLALELEEKVRERVRQVVITTLMELDVKQEIYNHMVYRLLYDKQVITKLAEHLHILERETRYNHSTNAYPWRG